MASEVLNDFAFRELENGPRRDIAREFYEFALQINWLQDGELKDTAYRSLLKARNDALAVAETMLR